MRKTILQTVLALAVFGLLTAAPIYALTIDELIELCQAGYSTEDILEFVETLGLDEPLDSDVLVRLKEEGCADDLAVELLRAYGPDEPAEYEYVSGYDEPYTRVYVYAGWGYPYYGYGDWCRTGWYSPWWGVGVSWYDPWYWDYWYSDYYYYPYSHWARWRFHDYYQYRDRYWRWGRSDYRHVTAHEKTKKTRGRRIYRTKASPGVGDYRAAVSRSMVEKSYKSRDAHTTRVKAYAKKDKFRRSKADYYVKDRRSDKTTTSAVRKIRKGTSASGVKTDREGKSKKAKYKSTKKSRTSSGIYKRSSGSSRSPDSKSVRYRPHRSSRSSAYYRTPITHNRRSSSSGLSVRRSGYSAGSSSRSSGYTAPSSSSRESSGRSGSTSSSSRARRR